VLERGRRRRDDDGDDGEFVLAVRASGDAVGGPNGVVERLGGRNAVRNAVGVVGNVAGAVGNVAAGGAVLGVPVGSTAVR